METPEILVRALGAPPVVWIAAVLILAGALAAVGALRAATRQQSSDDVLSLGGQVIDVRRQQLRRSRRQRLLNPMLEGIGEAIAGLVAPSWLRAAQDEIDRAGPGSRIGVGGLIAMRVVLAGLWILGALTRDYEASPTIKLGVAGVGAAIGWAIPSLYLTRVADRRIAQINRELPDVLDQIIISLSAGLGIDAAIGRVAEGAEGVLAHELLRTIADVRMGIERSDAFERLALRCRSEDLSAVTAAIVQGLEMGASLTPVLEARAADLRKRRRAHAEERAHKLSVKLALPTAMCILPALLLIVVGPAILQVLDEF